MNRPLDYLSFHFDISTSEGAVTLDEVSLWSAPFGWKLLSQVRMRHGMRVLDVGSGTGFPTLELAQCIGESGTVIALDPWEGGHACTRAKMKTMGVTNVELLLGTAEKIPLEAESIDLIVSNNGINNVEDVDTTFRELHRVAKPAAQFVFTMNTNETFRAFYNLFTDVLRSAGIENAQEIVEAHIAHKRMPLDEMTSRLASCGFKVEQLLHDEFAYRFVDGSAMLRHFFIKIGFLPPWKALVPETLQERVFTEVETRLNRHAEQAGELRMEVPFALFDCTRE